jgi:hypothetical protein
MSKLHFKRKAMPVIPEHRPMYKISQILLILNICSIGSKSSLIRLHLFNWALKDEQRIRTIVKSAEDKKLTFGVWGIDPALNMALNYATADGLINRTSSGYVMTERGNKFISKSKLIELFNEEVKTLSSIGKKITETMVKDVAQRWKNEI